MDIIKIDGLCKSYGEVKAVQNISFRVKEGELFAFLGLNGAGKSTTISIICGTLQKDSGEVEIDGKRLERDAEAIRREIGVVFQNSVLDKPLSVYDNLKMRCALYGIVGEAFEKRLQKYATAFAIIDFLHRPVGKLSGGQRRRVDLVRALMHEPKILILDEPTTGLDPQTRTIVWKVIETLRKERNMTVLLTTHYLEEASEADYAVILDGGKIVAEGTPLELKNAYTGDYITLYGVDEAQVRALGKAYEKRGNAYRIVVANTKEATDLILANPDAFTDYEIVKGKMDDVFLAVTGKSLKGENE
jgi:multidrug/hemolysin transport system ATP-binding protein